MAIEVNPIFSTILNNTYLMAGILSALAVIVSSSIQAIYYNKKIAKLDSMLSQTANICAFKKERKALITMLSNEIAYLQTSEILDSTSKSKLEPCLIELDQRFLFIFDSAEQSVIKRTLAIIHDVEPNLPQLMEYLIRIRSILKTERKYVDD